MSSLRKDGSQVACYDSHRVFISNLSKKMITFQQISGTKTIAGVQSREGGRHRKIVTADGFLAPI